MEKERYQYLLTETRLKKIISNLGVPVVAFTRCGSQLLGLADNGSDNDIVLCTVGVPALQPPFIIIDKKTQQKISLICTNVLLYEYSFFPYNENLSFLLLWKYVKESDFIVTPGYEDLFNKQRQLVLKHYEFFKAYFCQSIYNNYKDFIAGDTLTYHRIKFLYYWLYFYYVEHNLAINKELITKFKRARITKISDLSESEKSEFLNASNYIISNFIWGEDLLIEQFKQIEKEVMEIGWE